MLKNSQSLFAYHVQAMIRSVDLLCQKPLATMMTIVVIAIALALPALFWVFNNNLSKLTANWQRGGTISLYLQSELTQAEQNVVMKKVRQTQGVGSAVLKSPEEGLLELTKQEGMQDIMRYLPENPLPAMIEVTPAVFIDSPAKLDLLSRHLKVLPKVDVAKVDMEWVSRLHAALGVITKITHALVVLLAAAVVLVIGNTLRLSIQSSHEEIQVLKLIGAADPYIVRPFLYSGIWYGLAGAAVAVFLVNIFILSLGMVLSQLMVVYQMSYKVLVLSISQILILSLFAIILGWLGARLSVKRQLASIEPYN
jgi:cell division transport system permease protein